MQWGEKGTPPNEKRPGYFSSVHGIAVDPTTRRVYINDRNNGRLQVFDENGKFLDQWNFGPRPPMNIHTILMGSDHKLWAADQGGNKMLQYDAEGHFLYAWGTYGHLPGLHLGRAWLRDGCGRQSVYGGSSLGPRAEVHATPGSQSGILDRQALEVASKSQPAC